MTAARRLFILRTIGFSVAALLATAALFDITAQVTRPDFRAADLFRDGARLPIDVNRTAGTVSLDGDIRADFATLDAMIALGAAHGPDRIHLNKTAQAQATAILASSPAQPLMWVMLGLLRAQAEESSAGALKASYLTGAISREVVARRISAVATTAAVDDEEIRLLAPTDVRAILTKYPRLEPVLVTAYRQASQSGKTFLIDAAQMVDPRFSKLLKQN